MPIKMSDGLHCRACDAELYNGDRELCPVCLAAVNEVLHGTGSGIPTVEPLYVADITGQLIGWVLKTEESDAD